MAHMLTVALVATLAFGVIALVAARLLTRRHARLMADYQEASEQLAVLEREGIPLFRKYDQCREGNLPALYYFRKAYQDNLVARDELQARLDKLAAKLG